jgi:uncharacterized membrane protein
VNFDRWVSDVVQVVEAFGAAIMILGGLVVFVQFIVSTVGRQADAYRELRRNFGRVIQLGLEVLIVADIVRTIIVDPTLQSVAVLGSIVVIRIVLSWAIELETEGTLPWQHPRRPAG